MIGDPFATIIGAADLLSDAESVDNHVHFFVEKIVAIIFRSNLTLGDEIDDFSPDCTDVAFDEFYKKLSIDGIKRIQMMSLRRMLSNFRLKNALRTADFGKLP
jgi:hypothetical protein